MNSVTVEQAKQLWCPFARLGIYGSGGICAVNRHPTESVEEDCRCRADGCAAWRWDHLAAVKPEPRTQAEKIAAARGETAAPELTHGFCGLAGR